MQLSFFVGNFFVGQFSSKNSKFEANTLIFKKNAVKIKILSTLITLVENLQLSVGKFQFLISSIFDLSQKPYFTSFVQETALMARN